ncbi:LapA family protein [Georgenia yuyongxinii]|uniref:DUF1049 domain-containing protein n=1 Tax=Georgenia yuyongxinii TaxID=2589797 RepID=A0A552WVX0_9MICO|nr:lipopolysaccharide assembly protein LapA domain-containing protein [Georgenia yuyongxinii]TRW46944.1 DUF1049 domain-containing protein [Georgenia yuyongxinii]
MAVGPEAVRPPETGARDAEGTSSNSRARTPRSRAGAAWVGICVAAIVLVALIVFMLQNTQRVLISFFSFEGMVPLSLALLIAGVGVGIVALVIGSVRIAQLRRRLTHERQR